MILGTIKSSEKDEAFLSEVGPDLSSSPHRMISTQICEAKLDKAEIWPRRFPSRKPFRAALSDKVKKLSAS